MTYGARRTQRQGDHGAEDPGLRAWQLHMHVGCKMGDIAYKFETEKFYYDTDVELLADVIDVEKANVRAL